jgi:DedD protein
MSTSEDTEITLGTGKLVGLFFGLVILCAIFFGLGYSLGHKSETAAAVFSATPAASAGKPGAAATHPSPAGSAESAFRADHPDQPQSAAPPPAASADAQVSTVSATTGSAADPSAPASTGSYSVQVAAVSHEEDAGALAEALRKKQYSAAVVAGTGSDKLFHVQVGPFADIKDAEAMKARLVSDGYNPIVKK